MQPRAWPLVQRWIEQAANDVSVLPAEPPPDPAALDALGLTTRSVLGALAVHTGGLLIDHGWLRVLGGAPLLAWSDRLAGGLVVGHDAVGGFYGVVREDGEVRYLLPGGGEWIGTEMGHAAWVHWTMTGDLDAFYAEMREPGWRAQVAELAPDQGLTPGGPAPIADLWSP